MKMKADPWVHLSLGDGFISHCLHANRRESSGWPRVLQASGRESASLAVSPETPSWPSPRSCTVTAWAAHHGVRPCQGLGQTCTSSTSRIQRRQTGYTPPPPHTPGRRCGRQPQPSSSMAPVLLWGPLWGRGRKRSSTSRLTQNRRVNPRACQLYGSLPETYN